MNEGTQSRASNPKLVTRAEAYRLAILGRVPAKLQSRVEKELDRLAREVAERFGTVSAEGELKARKSAA